ncbi:glycosyltransferase family 1 protein [Streptomyces sp. ID01-12c]|uniref:glycosyltransferase n=1 Tax=Streptomyces caniscabiei TaxID=2746961 RepID=UPI0017848DCD|nr:glycosyltransferase [Streptomyces caniscabiei]MBD9701279.1 glycosyltransferase family 1 protein [Streptomyces caniscabiei]MDX3726542.1 glycosyltransferase [Streptomyces caniscabiei]
MRVLLANYDSRGGVEPLVGLAVRLRGLGAEVRVCAPPDEEFARRLACVGVPLVPFGRPVRALMTAAAPPTPDGVPRRAAELLAEFGTVAEAAEGCDVLVATGLLPAAACVRSVADRLGVPYVYASFQSVSLPSPHHPPMARPGRPLPTDTTDNRALWEFDARSANDLFGEVVDTHRASVGLPPVTDVRDHVFTDRPWLATDPVLDPWRSPSEAAGEGVEREPAAAGEGVSREPSEAAGFGQRRGRSEDGAAGVGPESSALGRGVVQTGTWIVPDERPLADGLTAFLDAGAPPVYVGFGSIPVGGSEDVARACVEAVRAHGRRVVLSRGWADLAALDDRDDCFVVGEANHHALFRRVAAVVHHGGAGTTTTATWAGTPQVVVPQGADQPYFASRVAALGIGVAHDGPTPTFESLSTALKMALAPETATRAAEVAGMVLPDGATRAARRLLDTYGGGGGGRDGGR